MSEPDELNDKISQLVVAACSHPQGSIQRQRYLTQLIRLILASNKLWIDSAPYYEDSLQQTWLYFCTNLCEAVTANEAYNSTKGQVTTWLNAYLKRRLDDKRIEKASRQTNYITIDISLDEILEAPPEVPDCLKEVQEWVEADKMGELRNTHIRGRKDVNCQVVILRRLPPEQSWKEISEELGVAIPTLSAFYERKCRPLLQKFGREYGYLE